MGRSGEAERWLLAAYASDERVLRGYAMGAADFVVKPYEPAVLLAKVRRGDVTRFAPIPIPEK